MERQNLKLKKTLEVLKKLREENISIDDLIEAIEVVNQLSGEVSITEEQNVPAAMIEMEKERAKSIEMEVTEQLHKFGIPSNIKGFNFIRTGILMGLQNPECMESATKVMYPSIAKEYKTTSSGVERAIRHAIEVAWTRGNLEEVLKFFPCYATNTTQRATNMEFLATIVDYYKCR